MGSNGNCVIIDCVKDHLRAMLDNVIVHCNISQSILEVESLENSGKIDRFELTRCHIGFYSTYVKVGVVTSTTYKHITDVYYNDPYMLNILKNLVCDVLGRSY